jgi:similar to stage IV sporulation protein
MSSGIKFTLKGLNHARLINDLSRQDVSLSCITRESIDIISFVVPSRDRAKVVDYITKKCYNVIAVEEIGLRRPITAFKSHFLVSVAVILAVVLLIIGSGFCFRIELDTTKDHETIISLLKDYGIKKGTFVAGLDYDKLENYLANHIDGVSYAIVDLKGSTLYIRLVDSLPAKEVIDYSKPRDIIATRSGVVTRIVCRQGTPKVKVGDHVKEGQVLIEGLKTFPDGTTEKVRADGEVYASVSSSHSIEFSPTGVEYVRTGKVKTSVSFEIFDRIVNPLRAIKFDKYETESKEYTLFPILIKVIATKVYELKAQVVNYTFTERFPLLAQEAEQIARKYADFEIKDVLTQQSGNIITVTVIGEMIISD